MTTTNTTDRLYVADNQRSDKTDFQRLIDDPMDALRRAVRLTAERSPLDASGVGCLGCVLRKKDVGVTLADGNVTFGAGLELVFAAPAPESADEAPTGDIHITTDGDEVATGAQGSGPTNFRIILARPSVASNTVNDDRVRWVESTKTFEVFNTPTRKTRSLEWTYRVSTDAAGLLSDMEDGYHLVCMVNSSLVLAWYTLFPVIANTTKYPEEQLTSVAQSIAALAKQLGMALGTTWDADLDSTDADLAHNYDRVEALKALVEDDPEISNVELGNRATALEARKIKMAATFKGTGSGLSMVDSAGVVHLVDVEAGVYRLDRDVAPGSFYSATVGATGLDAFVPRCAVVDFKTDPSKAVIYVTQWNAGSSAWEVCDVAANVNISVSYVEWD